MSSTAQSDHLATRSPPPPRTTMSRRRIVGVVVALVALALLAALSVMVGVKSIPISVVWDAVVAPTTSPDHLTVRDLRIPRTITGLIAGVGLGVAGALVQALIRNPLADPGILGVNAGAAFGVAIGMVTLGARQVGGYHWFAYAGALVVTAGVMLMGSTRFGRSPVVMVLVGVSIGAVLDGAVRGMLLLDPQAFDQMRAWRAGSLVGRPLEVAWTVLPLMVVGVLLALAIGRSLNSLALGDDLAAAQGVRIVRVRLLAVASISLLAGGATALAGPIAFVGLMVPHVARWITGPDHRWIIAYSALFAPILLLTADLLGRVGMAKQEIPVGVVTAFVGAPVLIVLVRRRKASGL